MALALVENKKICNHCKNSIPYSLFGKNMANKDYKQINCLSCDKEIQREKRLKNHEQLRINEKKYKEKVRYSNSHRLQALLNSSRQRALQKNREHTLIKQDLIDLYPIDGLCPIFGFKLEWNDKGFRETSPSIDRIDSNKGYTKDNIQIISWKANRIKSYATIEELEIVLNYMKSGG